MSNIVAQGVEDIEERRQRREILLREAANERRLPTKKLTQKEAKELAERLKEDLDDRLKHKARNQELAQRTTILDEEVRQPEKIKPKALKELTDRLYSNEVREKHLKALIDRQEQDFHDDHPFKPTFSENSRALLQQKEEREQGASHPAPVGVQSPARPPTTSKVQQVPSSPGPFPVPFPALPVL